MVSLTDVSSYRTIRIREPANAEKQGGSERSFAVRIGIGRGGTCRDVPNPLSLPSCPSPGLLGETKSYGATGYQESTVPRRGAERILDIVRRLLRSSTCVGRAHASERFTDTVCDGERQVRAHCQGPPVPLNGDGEGPVTRFTYGNRHASPRRSPLPSLLAPRAAILERRPSSFVGPADSSHSREPYVSACEATRRRLVPPRGGGEAERRSRCSRASVRRRRRAAVIYSRAE